MDNKNGIAQRQQEHKDRQTLTAEEMAVKSAKRTGNERARREILATMQAENGGSHIMDKDTLINNLLANELRQIWRYQSRIRTDYR